MYDAFDCCIDRTRLAQSVYGNIYPASNWFEIWDYATPPATFLSGYTGENYVKADVRKYTDRFADLNAPLVIEYAAFSPNRELAAELGRQLSKITGCSVLTREIDYSILLSNPRQTHAVRLVLRFFPWAHPAAMLYPSFAHSRSKRLLGTLRPDPADLSDAYRRQQQLQGEIVVGGLRSAMLTRLEAFESPPTGWFDSSDLLRQKAR
ncbi:hypothetical protein ACTXN3_12405 [Corynebacterium flavescens]